MYLFEPIHSIGDGLAGPAETLTVKNCRRFGSELLFALITQKKFFFTIDIKVDNFL